MTVDRNVVMQLDDKSLSVRVSRDYLSSILVPDSLVLFQLVRFDPWL
jgi:hypothetical protein